MLHVHTVAMDTIFFDYILLVRDDTFLPFLTAALANKTAKIACQQCEGSIVATSQDATLFFYFFFLISARLTL